MPEVPEFIVGANKRWVKYGGLSSPPRGADRNVHRTIVLTPYLFALTIYLVLIP